MNIEVAEITLFWLAVILYAVATVLAAIGVVWTKQNLQRAGNLIFVLALFPHGIAIILRWLATGHGPYLQTYEIVSSDAWVGAALFMLLLWRLPRLMPAALFVYPLTLAFSGWALLSSREISQIPATFQTIWLIIHIIFAKFTYGSALISSALAGLYLLKKSGKQSPWLERLPEPAWLDYYSYRLSAFAFLMAGVMIVAGAIWANQAWGYYWAWDPIETWSLISWLLYGLYLHYRFTGGKPRRAALLNLLSLLILLITLFAVPYLYDTVHSEYMS